MLNIGKYSKLLGFICLGLSMFIMLCLPSISTAEQSEDIIKLSLANFFPTNHYVNTREIPAWVEALEDATNGRVKIEVYSGGTLLTGPETYDGVVNGVADIGVGVPAWSPGRFPLWKVFELPGLYIPDAKAAALITWEAVKKIEELGLPDSKLLFIHSTGPGCIYSKKPVSTPDDLKGMRVYATSIASEIAKELGASPVGGDRSEIYIMLQKGIIDGDISGPPEVLLGYNEAEVIDYITLQAGQHGIPGFYNKTHFWFMNNATWNSLPPDIQKAFEEVSDEFVEEAGEIWKSEMAKGLKFAKEEGVEFIELTPEEAETFVDPIRFLADEWAKEMESKGIPGKRILSTVREICNKYK